MYKLKGPVNLIKINNKKIHAIANKNIFYELDTEVLYLF